MNIDVEMQEAAALDVDQLLRQLARSQTLGSGTQDPRREHEVGLALLRAWFATIKESVCGDGVLASSVAEQEDVLRDAGFVADLFLAGAGQPPVATLSVLIVKYGVARLCSETAG